MIIHRIRDLSNSHVTNVLRTGLQTVTDENYNLKQPGKTSNIFAKLSLGMFRNGAYHVIEDNNGHYVGSTGWIPYVREQYNYKDDYIDHSVALVMVRSFVSPQYRNNFILSKYCLPVIIEDIKKQRQCRKLWITVNVKTNRALIRALNQSHAGTLSWIPHDSLLWKFKPIGVKTIKSRQQYVYEYDLDKE